MKEKKSMIQLGKELTKDHVDLTEQANALNHDETLRATALSLACRYYVETIVKDGDLYREMVRDNRVLKPATYLGVIEVAISFEAFINGEIKRDAEAISKLDDSELASLTESDREEPTPSPTRD